MDLSQYVSELVSAVIGAIAGAGISIPITVRVMAARDYRNATSSNQKGARAGGDITGRDKIVKR